MAKPKRVAQTNGVDYTVAELFCGCGGFSHGFTSTNRFRAVFGNDVKRFALRSFEVNHAHNGETPTVLQKDIRTVTDAELAKLLGARGVTDLDCLIGGPPCQGFSQMRRSEERRGSKVVGFGGYNKLDQDSRNDLVEFVVPAEPDNFGAATFFTPSHLGESLARWATNQAVEARNAMRAKQFNQLGVAYRPNVDRKSVV